LLSQSSEEESSLPISLWGGTNLSLMKLSTMVMMSPDDEEEPLVVVASSRLLILTEKPMQSKMEFQKKHKHTFEVFDDFVDASDCPPVMVMSSLEMTSHSTFLKTFSNVLKR
jgi:hypothetical protein